MAGTMTAPIDRWWMLHPCDCGCPPERFRVTVDEDPTAVCGTWTTAKCPICGCEWGSTNRGVAAGTVLQRGSGPTICVVTVWWSDPQRQTVLFADSTWEGAWDRLIAWLRDGVMLGGFDVAWWIDGRQQHADDERVWIEDPDEARFEHHMHDNVWGGPRWLYQARAERIQRDIAAEDDDG